MKSFNYCIVVLMVLIGQAGCENQDLIFCEESYKLVETLAISQEQEIAELQQQQQADQAKLRELRDKLVKKIEQYIGLQRDFADSKRASMNKDAAARKEHNQLYVEIKQLESSLAGCRQEQGRLEGELEKARRQIEQLTEAPAQPEQAEQPER